MIYIILSICCSVIVAILLKLAKRYQINIIQAVISNYLMAIVLCYFFFKPNLNFITTNAPWAIYLSLGILLPSIFLFLAASIKNLGIVKTDIAQRLSLFIPILAAYFLFKEDFSLVKFLGLGTGFLAILFTFIRKSENNKEIKNWIYPVTVFVGFGVIDVLFKQVALNKAIPYTTSLFTIFCIAFLVATIIVLVKVINHRTKIQLVNLGCGLILGLFNFGNILFYLKAHQYFSKNPSTVFGAMNLGVIALGTLIGVLIFKEKLSVLNYIGILLAICAVLLITISQLYAV
ncbi:DMT family transporter [Pedobacter changchengzhani]|uniref:DMT family transporter n=1 Tax=Pedobacter changchengzhani TaxID=2529274 RepID=A0A4R5MHH8_9SPHI|nr:DMT family transporter [Pedobacter changchengzhani]TDG35007.1 DMT family transporter [Pedobacter changchengzhani]